MIRPLRKRIGIAVMAVLMIAGIPAVALQTPASAAGVPMNRTLSVTINEINCGSACDGEGIEGPFDGEPDWFARVFMNGGPANPARLDAADDDSHITPNWVFTQTMPMTQQTMDVRIQVWDRDDGSDDLADDTKQGGDKNLDFTLDVKNNKVVSEFGGEVDGAIGTKRCTFGNGDDGDGSAYICFTAGTGDRDGDGLQDNWETNGIDFDNDGLVDLPLNAAPFNANPDHKDIYMEIDSMACAAGGCAPGDVHSHTPQPGAVNDVVAAFAAAPVPNPDGNFGITLHAFQDELIPEISQVLFQSNGPGTNDDFNDIKNGNPVTTCNRNGWFGTSAERGSPNCTAILNAKRAIFQYVVFGHSYSEGPTSSGISELDPLGGNDLMVTFGGWNAASINAAGGQRVADASTLMHEFGHNLSLGHGGFEGKNCKPNYLSIMSYSLQFPNIDGTRPMDYSTSELPKLDETALPATGGVGGPASRNTVVGVGGVARVFPANGPINWNGSGGTTGDVDFISSINPDCQNPSPGDTNMLGHDDWSNLVYDHTFSPMFADGASRMSPVEITKDEVIAVTPTADLHAAKVVDKTTAQPGDTLHYDVTASNAGPGKAIGVKVTDTLPGGATQERNVGDLAVGASSVQPFDYTIACDATDGTTLTNNATVSGTNIAFVDDPNQADNSASASTVVSAPKVVLTKTSSPTNNAGAAITNTLTYQNTGTSVASNVVITDKLPSGIYYSTGLDTGTGPQPSTVVHNADGTTTLTWNIGTVAASSAPVSIGYTTRASLLSLGGTAFQNSASVSFANANGCAYSGPAVTATSTVNTVPPTRNPLSQGYWRNHPQEWTPEILARIQATDQRYDGADGSTPNGVLSASEVSAAMASPGGYPRVTNWQLLAGYFNLASGRITASTTLSSTTDTRLGLTNVRDAGLYAQATLAMPVNSSTQQRYYDTTAVWDEINNNVSERY